MHVIKECDLMAGGGWRRVFRKETATLQKAKIISLDFSSFVTSHGSLINRVNQDLHKILIPTVTQNIAIATVSM